MSEPANFIDEQVKYHEIRYYIEQDAAFRVEQKAESICKAKEIMITAVKRYSPPAFKFKERFLRLVILTCLKFNVNFGLVFTEAEAL